MSAASPWEKVEIDGETWLKREMHGFVWAFKVGQPSAHLVTSEHYREHWEPDERPAFELTP